MANAISIRPSEMVEGGAVPVDRNLLWKECRFALFDYGGKAPQTCAARITLVDDDGQEFIQYYSAADPARFSPAADGKTIVAVGAAQALSKSSNFFLLMNELVNAGFPENKLSGDISVLDGLYAYHIGMPEPKRSGMAPREVAEGEKVYPKVISVPQKVLRLPWEKAPKGGKGVTTKATKVASAEEGEKGEEGGEDIQAAAIAFVKKVVADGATTRQKLAARVFKDLAKDPNRDAIAGQIFKPEFQAALMAADFSIDGENISKD